MRLKIFAWLLTLGLLLAPAPMLAQEVKQPPAAKATAAAPQTEKTKPSEPDPLELLQKMCDFLKSQQKFTYKAEVADDQVYAGGKKLQYEIDMETFVRRPDRLRVNADGDLVNKEFFFDGKTITLYDKNDNVYGTLETPSTIDGALEKASKDFGVRVALTDLASPDLWDLLHRRIKHSLYVGLSRIRGVSCHHLSFDGDKVQLQVWIAAAGQPLPRKVVLTHKDLPGEPQWIAYLRDWNLSPQLNDSLFIFTPPEGAEKIKFVPLKAAPAPKPKPGKKKKRGRS